MGTHFVKRDVRGSHAFRVAGLGLALAFRVIPARFRFQAAITFARWIEPLIKRTPAYAGRAQFRMDGLRETSLDLVLMMLSRHRTVFHPDLHIEGLDHLPAIRNGGTLLVGPHTMLSRLFVRYLEDIGIDTWMIDSDNADQRIPGTRAAARVLLPSATLYLKVKRLLAGGKTIIAMIDRGHAESRASRFETDAGHVFVSYPLLQLALRQRAQVVFIAARVDARSRVVIRLSVPAPESRVVSETLRDFITFLDKARRDA